ncbi:MAG: DUF4982 domain-containing protein [Bacteroidaceae bacterium]|nr:DUF4982 domain-containing protein [Bacteroidaceae bacterium]
MRKSIILVSFLLSVLVAQAQQYATRTETVLTDGWQFSRDKQVWEDVSVPHDWAIAGPFDKKWDLQRVAIIQNGEREASEKTGRSGALPWIGDGHYRKNIVIDESRWGRDDVHAELVFDGAMAEPTVFVNGQKAGYWAYGYNTFRVDITPYLQKGQPAAERNLKLEVDLKNMEESSRWYPGAGIYRPVTLVITPKTHIDDWSIYFRCNGMNRGKTVVEAEAKAVSGREDMAGMFVLKAPDGSIAAKAEGLRLGEDGLFHATFSLENAKMWSPETPYLYTLTASIADANGNVIDSKNIKTGIRTVRVSRDKGFQLNGVTRKFKGVCLHHDLGPLGTAINKAALIRQIKALKGMGCDAIRTAHNMPSQWQMEICDSLGMMVMAESFDMWIYPKCKNGYARFFHEWADRDITNLVLANRNHPSIVMWSIGNEIPEQGSDEGRLISTRLQGLCHALDPSRPVTQGLDRAEAALGSGVAQAMDVAGFNYRVHKYKKNLEKLPQGFLLGSETASTVSSRGVYQFPVVTEAADNPASNLHKIHYNGQCTSYDVQFCSWSNLPDDDWRWQDDYDWVIGEFVWTGYDYLGEPSPYDGYWPSRSSYFGIFDLAGLPKDRYYLYRSKWNDEEHTIHLLPHWSWGRSKKDKNNRIGEVTPVYCYTDYPCAELFVNGKSQGKREKLNAGNDMPKDGEGRLDRYRIRWNEVKYEPGELKVVVYDGQGKKAGEQVVRTAGKPSQLKLDVWTQQSDGSNTPTLYADGQDLAFITVSLTDKQGTLIPDADDQLAFEVTGAGSFEAVCNGDATSLESFVKPTMKLFSGQLVMVVRSSKEAGTIKVKVTDKNRKLSKTVSIPTKRA